MPRDHGYNSDRNERDCWEHALPFHVYGQAFQHEDLATLTDAWARLISSGDAGESSYCTTAPSTRNSPSWNGYGLDMANSRFQSAESAGITSANVPKLKLKWAFGFPDVTTSFGTPTVVRGWLYIGSADGTVYVLNAISGCIYWTYKATGVRTGTIISPDRTIAYISDLHAWVHAVNTQTGAQLWTVHVENHPSASITGSLKLVGDRLYVPVSGGGDELAAGEANFVCCKFRGSLVALDAKTGKQIWKSYTISDVAKMTGKTANGTEVWEPSGASIWSTPTIDLRKHAIYFGTGVNYTRPATKTSDAVVAFDISTGKTLWSQQLIEVPTFTISGALLRLSSTVRKPPDITST